MTETLQQRCIRVCQAWEAWLESDGWDHQPELDELDAALSKLDDAPKNDSDLANAARSVVRQHRRWLRQPCYDCAEYNDFHDAMTRLCELAGHESRN